MIFIFDMGGVCTNNASENNMHLHELLGISRQDFYKFMGLKENGETNLEQNVPSLIELCANGLITEKQMWQTFSQRSGLNVQTDWYHMLFHPKQKPQTYSIISQLKQQGHRVVCGINTIDGH